MRRIICLSISCMLFFFGTHASFAGQTVICRDGDIKPAVSQAALKAEEDAAAKQTTITFIVEQPQPGSRYALCLDKNVGHTFIRIQCYTCDSRGNIIGNVIYAGYFPKEKLTRDQIVNCYTVRGEIRFDSNKDWNIAKVYAISPEQAHSALMFISRYNKDYNLASNNCTTFAVDVLKAAGVNSPTAEHKWSIHPRYWLYAKMRGIDLSKFYGYDPGDAGEDIRNSGEYLVRYNMDRVPENIIIGISIEKRRGFRRD